MYRGYFALWRKFQDHPFWKEKRVFSKAEAWIDLLWEAQHEKTPQQVVMGMTSLQCNYGESLKSLETWSKRWRWNKSRVRRFLKLLENMGQVVTENETKTTRVRILNYSQYDPRRNGNDTQVKRERNGSETEATPDKNVKNEKNVKNTDTEKSAKPKQEKFNHKDLKPSQVPAELWYVFIENRKFKKLQNTERALKVILKSFEEGLQAGYTYEQMIDRYISSGMQRFKVEWMRDKEDRNGGKIKPRNKKEEYNEMTDGFARELLEEEARENGKIGTDNGGEGNKEVGHTSQGERVYPS